MEQTFSAHEFARLAGVTVRALHYYDQTGLLTPSRRGGSQRRGKRSSSTRKVAEFGVREYRQADLLRLGQILTLKQLGFSLADIRVLLDDKSINIRDSLAAQQNALQRQIEDLQTAVRALQITVAHLDTTGSLDWEQVTAMITAVGKASSAGGWIRQFFSETQLAQFEANFDPHAVAAGTQAWTDLIARFKAMRHLPIDHPDLIPLVQERARLLDGFTHGDADVIHSLERMYSDPSQIPDAFRNYDDDTFAFMNAVVAYHAGKDQ